MTTLGHAARATLFFFVASGCRAEEACPAADLSRPSRPAAYAVISSDYASTAVALLDAKGALLDEAFIDSGTVPPGVVAALSGDVVLSTTPLAPCVLTLVDRFLTDVITFLDVCEGAVLGQLEVGAPSGTTNPHDVLALDDERALVSRHDPADGAGNDLLLVQWRASRTAGRIDLSVLDAEVEVEGLDQHGAPHVERVRTFARPSRMVRLRAEETERVLVGLARLGPHFMVTGPGAVALVDVDAKTVRAVELPGLTGCDEVDAVPGRSDLAVVTCGGPAFADEDSRRAQSGVAILALSTEGSASIRSTWRASDHLAQPVYNTWAVPLDADHVVVTAMGDLALGRHDRVGLLTLGDHTGTASLMQAASAFVIGDGAYDTEVGLLLVPDAETGVIRRFARNGAALAEQPPVDTSGCRGLVPREVRRLMAP